MAAPRRYPEEIRQRAVRMVWEWRRERHVTSGGVNDVARQLGLNKETLRNWVRQADIDDGQRPGTTTDDRARIAEAWGEEMRVERAYRG